TEMRQQHRGLASDPRITIRRVRRDLLVTHIHKLHFAVFHRRENSDVRVTAKAENMAHSATFQISDQMICDSVFHKSRSPLCANILMKPPQHSLGVRSDAGKQKK